MVSGTNLDKIDHIIVLMLENRSFDDMLGWLYDPANPPPFDKVPRSQPFDGLSGKDLRNPIPPGYPGSERGYVPVSKATFMARPNPDPGEEYNRVNVQLFGTPNIPDPTPLPSMEGFVRDYITALEDKKLEPTYHRYRQIMETYAPAHVPVLSALANAYAVSDRWFCSVPTMTMPNRSFFHAATSSGLVLNAPYESWILNLSPTVFNRLEDKKLPWKVYYDPLNVVPLTWIIHRTLLPYGDHFCHFDDFIADCASGNLPAYSFLEPRFLLMPNDEHPPHAVPPGEALVAQVYEAVRKSPAWAKTLLCITFDEHGGCYDHVPPPPAVPPGDGFACPQGFRFDRLGLRVPMVMVSPWIEAGTVYRGTHPFDHTSMIKTLSTRFGLEPLTERDRAAEDIAGVLSLSTPRTDFPKVRAGALGLIEGAVGDVEEVAGLLKGAEEASPLHRAILGMTAARANSEVPDAQTVRDVHEGLKDLVPKLLPKVG